MALRSTQPLTEISTRNLPGGKWRPALKADNLAVICEPIVYKLWEPRRLKTLWASTACYRDIKIIIITSKILPYSIIIILFVMVSAVLDYSNTSRVSAVG
jgi:small-conductance mechanosensitive channel